MKAKNDATATATNAEGAQAAPPVDTTTPANETPAPLVGTVESGIQAARKCGDAEALAAIEGAPFQGFAPAVMEHTGRSLFGPVYDAAFERCVNHSRELHHDWVDEQRQKTDGETEKA